MSDFNQWRFKMHSTKSWVPSTVEVDEKPRFSENIFSSSSTSGASATLPKRKPRPKLMSYLGGHNHQSTEPEHFLLDRRPPLAQAAGISTTTVGNASEVSRETAAATEIRPNVELSVTTLMSRLLSDPGKGLSVQDTSLVLRMIESYRELGEEVISLKDELGNEKEKTKVAAEELQQLELIRVSDENDFRAEIKRLEMVIAEGKRGMSDLLMARQGSLIRRSRHPRETSLEDGFGKGREAEVSQDDLGDTEKNMQRWRESSTRTTRLFPQSPSRKMADLSRQFSTSNLQHEESLRTHSRGYESYTKPKLGSEFMSKDINAQNYTDSENSSISSCGDPMLNKLLSVPEAEKSMVHEEEMAIWQMATIIASRRGLDVADIAPALIQFFQDQASPCFNVSSKPAVDGQRTLISNDLSNYSRSEVEEKLNSRYDVNCQAGCDLIEFKEVSPKTYKRRFSFCPIDDDAAKLRDSWNRRKFAIEGNNGERRTSSSKGNTLANPKLRGSESCPNCSPRNTLSTIQLSRRSGNQNLEKSHSLSPKEIAAVMPIAATPDGERSTTIRVDGGQFDLRKEKDVEKTRGDDILAKPHPFARFPSSGSQHSIITAIWQDTNPNSNNYEINSNKHHCQHARCGSTRSSLSRGSHAHGQNLGKTSLHMTEPNNLLEHEDVD